MHRSIKLPNARWLILVCLVAVSCSEEQNNLVIENLSDTAISDIEIIVFGNTYFIEKIDAHQSGSITIEVSGESDVKLTFNNQVHTIDIYLEPNFSGTVRTGIRSDELVYGYYDF